MVGHHKVAHGDLVSLYASVWEQYSCAADNRALRSEGESDGSDKYS